MGMTLEVADKVAARICAGLAEYCDQISVAGSIRRRRPWVNDIDLVVLPKPGSVPALRERCLRHGRQRVDGPSMLVFDLRAPAGDIQVDLWIADPSSADLLMSKPTNFGSLLLCRTGSRAHNIWLIERAKALGLRWNPHHGVFGPSHGGEGHVRCLASATEADIFRILQLEPIAPELRER